MNTLIDRLRQHAQLHKQCTVQDDEQSMFANDLLAAVEEIDRLREVVEGAAAADEFKDSPGAMDRLAEYARAALKTAEAALADIGDADREAGDDLAWCERRAAQALPAVRAALEQK
jgi:hypothetical protein